MPYHVYMARLQNGCIYVGSTDDLHRRYQEHLSGNGSKATRDSKPVESIYSEELPDSPSAIKRERQLNRWSRAKKLALAQGRLEDLKALSSSSSKDKTPTIP